MITATLITRTPHKLRYKLVSDGFDTTSPSAWFIRNRNAVGAADLRYDADSFRDGPIDKLVNVSATTQAAARALLDGQGLTSASSLATERGKVTITPVTSAADPNDENWSVDENTGAAVDALSAGYAVITGFGPNVAGAAAIVDVEFEHTIKR